MKKKGISSQIQIKIGKTVGIIFIVVAVIVGLVVNASITDANNTDYEEKEPSQSREVSK